MRAPIGLVTMWDGAGQTATGLCEMWRGIRMLPPGRTIAAVGGTMILMSVLNAVTSNFRYIEWLGVWLIIAILIGAGSIARWLRFGWWALFGPPPPERQRLLHHVQTVVLLRAR